MFSIERVMTHYEFFELLLELALICYFFNPIPVELWNDVNRRGRAIMARIEFLPQI